MKELAILGGEPILSKKINRLSPFGKEELSKCKEVFNDGFLSRAGRGKYVKLFENSFANFHKVKYAVSTSSGTSALHTAVVALNIKEGDEVLVPALTFISSASVILQQKAKPVFVDIDPETFCLDPGDLRKKITKKTKAILVVHLYGYISSMDSIKKIASYYKLKIIEDCAQSHGAKYKNNIAGSLGDIACFSFYQTKNMSCGEGGMIITNNEQLYKNCSSIVDHGLIEGDLQSYDYDRLGYNYHLTEIQAAVGLEQLKKLRKMNIQRRKNAFLYRKLLNNTGLFFQKENKEVEHAYYCLTALLPKKFSKLRDWFVEAVRLENVEINKLYPIPLNKTKLFKKLGYKEDSIVANDVSSRLFNFYTNPGISGKNIFLTCEAVKKVLNYLDEKHD